MARQLLRVSSADRSRLDERTRHQQLTPRTHVRHSSSGSTATTSELIQHGSRGSESPAGEGGSASTAAATTSQAAAAAATAGGSPARGASQSRRRTARSESSVKVVARFRPRVTEDEEEDSYVFCVHPSGRAVESLDGSYHFELDRAFGEAASQEEVFEYAARPIVDSVLAGYNGTVFAYGQTSGGKTYSMFGPDGGDGLQPELLGIVPRAAQQIFDYIEAYPDDDTEFTLRCSLLEVYQEKMKDLLRPTSEKLRVKDLPQKGLVIDGLSKEYVTCAGDVMEVLRAGYRHRKVAQTRQNQHSSRSHAIFMLTVEQHSAVEGTERLGKLTLVDLAGSEKVSKSESVGQTLEEAKKINWSLSALGKVIDALAERRSHVPYRDSQLTRVLQEALGGNCRTTLLVAASACSQHWDETLSALRFASRAKKVRNLAKVNFMYSSDQLLMLVGQLQNELLGAKRQILNLGGISLERGKAAPRAQTVLRLGSSGSSPSFLKRTDEVGFDLEVESCLAKTSIVSSSSSRLIGTPRGSEEGLSASCEAPNDEDTEEDEALAVRDPYSQAYKDLALTARDAVWSLEAALLAQEQALEEARLLRARREDDGSNERSTANAALQAEGANPAADLLSERFRALRHAVDARSLHWRLQLEKHRSESLSLELEMRTRYDQDIERRFADATARQDEVFKVSIAQASKAPAAPGGGLGPSIRRIPLWQRGAPAFRTDAGSASSSGPRIARPVRRPSADSAEAPSAAAEKEASSASLPVGTSPVTAAPKPGLSSTSSEHVLWVAGTGDTGGEIAPGHGSDCDDGGGRGGPKRATDHQIRRNDAVSWDGAMSASAAVDSRVLELEQQLAATQAQNEALHHSSETLQAKVKLLQSDFQQQALQAKALSQQLSSRDIRIAAFRHEIRIKDALLGCLKDEERRRHEDHDEELELLMEQAFSPLAAILTREQTATAAAVGGRAGECLRRES